MSEMKRRMLSGELYRGDAGLMGELDRVAELVERYNAVPSGDRDALDRILAELLDEIGDGVIVRQPFRCDYGRISIGAGTFINYDCLVLDAAPIRIGRACQIATRVQLLTATHPIDPQARRLGWELAEPITIGDNVWLGGGVTVCPGVTIGDDSVVGAGAVVVGDLPAAVVAVGNPARVLRAIGDSDRVEVPQPAD